MYYITEGMKVGGKLSSSQSAPTTRSDVSLLVNPRHLSTRLRHILRRLLGLPTRSLVSMAAWFGFLAVVNARSRPGSSTDSRVNALLSIMGEFGYNKLLASTWKGNDPCEGWYGVNCVEGRMEYIFLPSLNLTGTISKRFGDLTSLYALDLSHNLLTGTIPSELTRLKLIRSMDLSYNHLHGKVPHFRTIIPDTAGNPGILRDVHSLAWGLSGGAMALALLLGVGIHLFRAWKRNRSARDSQPEENVTVPQSQQNEILESENKVFSLEILSEATQQFDSRNELGQGAFGSVYKGKLQDGTEIAVKKMVARGKGFTDQFDAELSILPRVRHRNLVILHGYCIQGEERLLVYEYMPQGALSSHLHKKEGFARLDWSTRLVVALDVARGLEYLHMLASQSEIYIHRDLKSSNVLLGEDFRAKISDFGLVRTTTEGKEPMTTKCVGTIGCTAPEYLESGKLSRKADVYSFGIILMELISGQKPYDHNRSKDFIAKLFEKRYSERDSFWKSIDEDIGKDHETLQSVNEVAELADSCCATEPEKRPEMSHIVGVLSSLIDIRNRRNHASTSSS